MQTANGHGAVDFFPYDNPYEAHEVVGLVGEGRLYTQQAAADGEVVPPALVGVQGVTRHSQSVKSSLQRAIPSPSARNSSLLSRADTPRRRSAELMGQGSVGSA